MERIHPLTEVFGYPINNFSEEAERHRKNQLCPFNNKSANCTKDKATDPLGVCTIFEGKGTAIICPVRFRQRWVIAEDAANLFFPGSHWTHVSEVRLNDNEGKSAGNRDHVIIAYDDSGKVLVCS